MAKKAIVTCEHAGNRVPADYHHIIDEDDEILNTHRGYDIGALELTHTIAEEMGVDPEIHKTTRLLVDLNRSLNHPAAFSDYLSDIEQETKKHIVDNIYEPHRQKVRKEIANLIEEDHRVVHLSVHTFTPQMNGVTRQTDIGLLFDPVRDHENRFCEEWRRQIKRMEPSLRVRMNYPYRGVMDGFSTSLRKEFPDRRYLGPELELNQKYVLSEGKKRWEEIQQVLAVSFRRTFEGFE
ncbi:MAG: N-formylglutamate amidohydrolase [Balneolaceae bacterium]|nr:N-formylglutamate amidohydrolase [Balneolaceae bacterium]